jgi:hypothetical protein
MPLRRFKKKQTKADRAMAVGRTILDAVPVIRLGRRYTLIAAITAPLALIVGIVVRARRRRAGELPPNESAPGHHPTEAEREAAKTAS